MTEPNNLNREGLPTKTPSSLSTQSVRASLILAHSRANPQNSQSPDCQYQICADLPSVTLRLRGESCFGFVDTAEVMEEAR